MFKIFQGHCFEKKLRTEYAVWKNKSYSRKRGHKDYIPMAKKSNSLKKWNLSGLRVFPNDNENKKSADSVTNF